MLQIKFSLLKHIMEISLSIPIVAQTLEVIVALIGSATQGHAHVWARAAAESHVRIQGLLKPGSVLMPNVPVTIEGQATAEMEGHVGVSGPYFCWVRGDIQIQPLLRTMSGSMVPPQLRSMLNSGS